MAGNIPKPRSYASILGGEIDTFVGKTNIKGFKVGGPILSALEASAQSQTRNTQDIFNLLDAQGLDRATGTALLRKAADEKTEKRAATASSGKVTLGDSRFTKIASTVYPGASAPNAGTIAIKVVDGSKFPATGQVYLGRGTVNYEGPISLDSGTPPVLSGSYWTVTLLSATQKFHDVNETVVLAQGGSRPFQAGQLIQTPQGNVAGAVGFSTLYPAVIEDGEVAVEGVDVVCKTPGITGNVLAGGISEVVGATFTGATVTNPLPFSNGLPEEDESQLKERLRNLAQTRVKGTALALTTNATGVTATDENRTVLSASVVALNGEPTTLFIDDGTGYEEKYAGISAETLMDQALGGEQFFALSAPKPVAKAFTTTTSTAPFQLVSGAKLSVKVAGLLTEHSFSASEFRSIVNATAYEVTAAINGNPNLLFSARTSEGGTAVVLFSRSDINEDVEVVTPSSGIDANTFLNFSTGINYSLRLYKNDQLLFKDGVSASVSGAPQSSWSSSIAAGVALVAQIDGTAAVTYTFTDSDFVRANTGYVTVAATNSLTAWAAVFNAKIPGITASAAGGRLVITSNRDASAAASVILSQPIGNSNNLITLGMFSPSALSAVGQNKDYSLDRNTGQLKLATVLAAGDALTAGTSASRAYLQGASLNSPTLTVATGGGNLWVVLDGAATTISTNLTGSTTLTISSLGNNRVRYTASASNIFGDVTNGSYLAAGDSVIVWDPNLNVHGAWRVSAVDASTFTYFEVERDVVATQSATVLSKSGMVFVRTKAKIQRLHVSSGTSRALSAIATELSNTLVGGTVSVYRNVALRLTTNSYALTGDVYIAAADTEAQKLLLPINSLKTNSSTHQSALAAGNPELGTPEFGGIGQVTSLSTGISFAATATPGVAGDPITSGNLVSFGRRLPGASYESYGANSARHYPLLGVAAGVVSPRVPSPQYATLVGGLVRVGTVVTVTISTGHEYTVGESIQIWPGEADFATGPKTVTGVTGTTFTYTEAGSAVASTLIQNVVRSQEFLVDDRFWAASPYAVGPYDQLNILLNRNTAKTYALPMYRRVKPSGGATYSSSGFGITDSDNSGATLATAFGITDTDFFRDFVVYMNARGKSHNTASNKALLWRYVRFGPEGNAGRVEYTNPTAPSQPISLATANGQLAKIQISLPSGAARTGLNLFDTTRFTASISNALNVNSVSVDTVRYTYSKPAIAIGGLVRAAGVVTATTTTAHGFNVGDVVYLTSTDGNYPPGAKTVVATATGSSFTYNEATGTTTPSTAVAAATSAPVDVSLGGLTIGDIVNISLSTGLPAAHAGAWRVSAVNASYFEVLRVAGLVSAITTPASIINASNLRFYPVNTSASKATDIATWIAANATTVVTATLLDAGSGAVTTSTLDEYLLATANASAGACVASWALTDGVNYVKASNLGVTPNTITFKDAVNSDLTSTADFANEELRLAPVTAAGLARYVGSPAISGFYASGTVAAANRGARLQLASSTLGSLGTVQVTGGTANAASAPITGSGSIIDTTYSKVTVATTSAAGLIGNRWIAIQASNTGPKATPWTSASNITVAPHAVAGQWIVTLSGGGIWTLKQSILYTSGANYVRIEKQGNFVAYTLPAAYAVSGTVTEGDWVNIQLSGANSINTGIKQVVRVSVDLATFWVENPNGISETATINTTPGSFFFYSYDSVMPGDFLIIDSAAFGVSNQGTFPVISNSYAGLTANQIIVSGSLTATGPTALGAAALFVRAFEANPLRLIKKISTIGQYPGTPNFSEIVFTTNALATKMSASTGTSIVALDKLAFDTAEASGADAYSYGTGLVGEVTRVIYGDSSNPSVYPGVVAAGANVNISGPLVKRIQVSLAVRLRTGAIASDVIGSVQNAVAAVINKAQLGQSIAIGAIVAAAQAVDGVSAVSVLSPTFSSGNDLIAIQANEKARVLDTAQDILVSPVGA